MKERQFSPNFWLSSRHVQTSLPVILPKPEVKYEREYLQMRDKGVVALDWVLAPHFKIKRKSPILLVLPSLTDGTLNVSHLCHAARHRGFRTVVVNRRGHGGSVLTTPKLLSFGDPADLRQVIKYLKVRMPKSPLAAIAYGTGCGLLVSYLGEFGSSALLSVGACVSPCYDVPDNFTSGPRNVYDLLLMLRLKAQVLRHAKALATVVNVEKTLSAWSFPELNRSVYCPLYGFSDTEEFWEANNPIRDVDDIAVPMLCINSLDNPVFSPADIPFDLFKCYPNFFLAVTQRGGHCGFLEGFPPKSWSDSLCLDYIDAVIEFTSKDQHKGSQQTHQHQSQRPRYYTISSSGHTHSTKNNGAQHHSNGVRSNSGGSRIRTSSTSQKRSTERFTI